MPETLATDLNGSIDPAPTQLSSNISLPASWTYGIIRQVFYMMGMYINLTLLCCYLGLVHILRFRRRRLLHNRYSKCYLNGELTDNDAWEILTTLGQLEFPAMFQIGLEYALFRVHRIMSLREK